MSQMVFCYSKSVVFHGGKFTLEGTCGNDWKHFRWSQLRGECYWHLMGQGQGFCSTSNNATKNYQNVSNAKVKKPWSKFK